MDILRNERTSQPTPASSASPSAQPAAGEYPPPRRGTAENPYTTLGKDTEFQGTLSFKEGLKIEGKFTGDISSDGHLIIGKTGEVHAEIKVGSIIVEGKINGNIVAQDLIELRSTAEMRGDITASKLKIEEGVVFVGKSDVQDNAARRGGAPGAKPSDNKPEEKKGAGAPAGK